MCLGPTQQGWKWLWKGSKHIYAQEHAVDCITIIIILAGVEQL